MNIYIGNLPFSATEDEVREMFSAFGQVSSVALISDRETGRARGFGFVEMPEASEAQNAIQALNGKEFKTRKLIVNEARPREERPRKPGGFGDRRSGSSRDPRKKGNW